jgi:hypothetical protein
MWRWSWMVVAGWLIITTCGAHEGETVYRFETPDYQIEMTVEAHPPYLGRRLVFYSLTQPGKELCHSGSGDSRSCIERFVGAVASVTYRFKPQRREVRQAATFREVVEVLAQAPGMAGREPYLRKQPLVRGVGSDLQVFGYDESGVAEQVRAAERSEWQGLWRVYRQELFVNGDREPFAVIEWKHTLERIEVLRTAGRRVADRP